MDNNPENKFVRTINDLKIRPELIAVTLGRSAASVYRWKTGMHKPKLTPGETAKFCRLLNVTVYELADMFGEPESKN